MFCKLENNFLSQFTMQFVYTIMPRKIWLSTFQAKNKAKKGKTWLCIFFYRAKDVSCNLREMLNLSL